MCTQIIFAKHHQEALESLADSTADEAERREHVEQAVQGISRLCGATLAGIVESMLQENPADRPGGSEVFERFLHLASTLSKASGSAPEQTVLDAEPTSSDKRESNSAEVRMSASRLGRLSKMVAPTNQLDDGLTN